MTPDEFDQKRRELIAMRTKYKDRPEVTNRVNNLLGQLLALAAGPHSERLDRAICRSLLELSQLTTSQ
jgi:hypothetical protein